MNGFIKKNSRVGLLLVRLALAFVFLIHGISKLENLGGTVDFFTHRVGLPEPVAYLVTAVEVLGGLAMLLGVFTEFAGVALAIEMTVTTFVLNFPQGIMDVRQLDLSMLLLALAVVFGGPGAFAVERWFRKKA
jgi:uncharacterized membrane protein YphA (DoxX/SURF4 family)